MSRKARNQPSDRLKGKKPDYEKVLIVCDGTKTEPFYFNAIKDSYRIDSANIATCGEGTPMKVIKLAKNLCQKEPKNDPFDRVFCVIDHDNHPDYKKALNNMGSFDPITSVPCFEYWLLLHFTYTTKHYGTADEAIKHLEKCMPSYEKNKEDVFKEIKNETEKAKKNAKNALAAAKSVNTDNPTTHVHELVDYLQNLKP